MLSVGSGWRARPVNLHPVPPVTPSPAHLPGRAWKVCPGDTNSSHLPPPASWLHLGIRSGSTQSSTATITDILTTSATRFPYHHPPNNCTGTIILWLVHLFHFKYTEIFKKENLQDELNPHTTTGIGLYLQDTSNHIFT